MNRMRINMPNRFFDNLAAKKVSVGGIITLSDLTVSELCGDCGMDFAWIDAEHCPHTIEGVMRHLIALRGTGCAGLVRVRECDPMLIKPYLDLAPDGIIIKEGLALGDRVIVSGYHKVSENLKVTVTNE